MWLYGSGFPKSLDISKAIDKAAGEVRGVVGMKHKIGRPNAANQSWARNGKSAGADYATHPKTLGIGMETAPATDAARTWHGWGTALKPAWEPIILAMKPLDGTFADNAQQWGVAGINVDGARIGTSDVMRRANNVTIGGNGIYGGGKPATTGALPGQGRWPANLLLDEEAAAALDAQSGERPSGGKKGGYGPGAADGGMWSQSGPRPCGLTHGDTGGASRFFYVAKASRADRGEGNIHPTCKPTELMRYLCRLTSTPTGGVVLDPFMGSGTTGVAAVQEGRAFIGIEKEAEYHEIARRRIEGVQPTLLQAAD
jgi:site-specific DNA-methyltransferase (adenine-specific)